MAKDKNAPRYDKQGARRVMRKRDYLADLGGQLALGLMANLVGQLTKKGGKQQHDNHNFHR